MSIAFVKRVGQDAKNDNATACVVTVPAAGVASGNKLLISFHTAQGTSLLVPTYSDTKGNTYSVDHVNQGAANRRLAVLSVRIDRGLVSGDTMTVTQDGVANIRREMDVFEFSGLGNFNAARGSSGASTGPNSLAGAVTAPNVLIFGAFVWDNTVLGETFDGTVGLLVGSNTIELGPVTVVHYLATAYRLQSTPAAVQVNGTIPTSQGWTASAVAYKAADDTGARRRRRRLAA